ncbi:MAG: GAF domain-containing sensor histidine kinase [bacterium]|jgi:signal transduction histidine kinase|nr:GAF domain-containing sensor histidine kinase [bacterium]
MNGVPRRARQRGTASSAQPEVEESLRELQLLHEAAHQLSSTLEREAVLQEACNITVQLLWPPDCTERRAHVCVLQGDRLVVTAEADDLGVEIAGLSVPVSAHPAFAAALEEGQAVVGVATPEFFSNEELRSAAARLKSRHLACIRIYNGPEPFGAITAVSRDDSEFTEWQLQRLEAAAALTGLAIGNADRLESAHRETQRLSELEAIKSQFLQLASHELRGPLGTLRAYTSLLSEGALEEDPSNRAKAYQVLDAKVRHMNLLVNQMLEAARLEEGRLLLSLQELDLRAPVVEAYEEARLLVPDSHELQLQEPGEPVMVRGDKGRLIAMTHNLLDNAIKYSPNGGAIRCRVEARGDNAVVEVSDQGLGIAAEEMPLLFNRFGRIVNGQNSHIPGAGLGLYLCRELARMHGGEITADSERGRGSIFRLSLPRSG